MFINWNESIGREIVVNILGYEANKFYDQKATTTILSVNETKDYYNIVTNPFYLANDLETMFFNLLEISNKENTNPTSAFIGGAGIKAIVTLK